MSRRIDRFGQQPIFRSKERGKSNFTFSTGSVDEYASNIRSENSFRYEPYGSPLKSTQQLPVDYTRFENHTFFNSAAAKVSVAFNKIVNKYPFDGTQSEIEEFEDKLTGYEKYILDIFPKHTGYFTPTGSAYISVKNIAGVEFPEFSSNKSAKKILDPINDSIYFETHLRVPNETSTNPMGLFYISGSDIKVEVYIDRSTPDVASATFEIMSGTFIDSITTQNFEKDKFNHVSFGINRNTSLIEAFVNGEKDENGTKTYTGGNISFNDNLNILRSGNKISGGGVYENFSGSIKDFRVYHGERKSREIKRDLKRTVYKSGNLKLNFRFNEPTGSYSIENYVLDTSGNSLHSKVVNFDRNARLPVDGVDSPVKNENKSRNHVLFPDYYEVLSLNNILLTSGSSYDKINPNLITNLIPPHYFEDAVFEDGNYSGLSKLDDKISGNSIPGSAKSLETGLLTVLLLSWANIFDEIKMFIDSFGDIIFSDYHDDEIVPDQMIGFAAKHLGIDLPPMFTHDNTEGYFNTNSVYSSSSSNKQSLKKIQSIIWKRILSDASYYKKTKGTLESIKSIFRSSGIDPDKMLAFIEKGSNVIYLSDDNREEKIEQIPFFNFSGSLAEVTPASINSYGFANNKPSLRSFCLTGSKIDNNFPKPGSVSKSNKLFTSGSWTVEGYYSFLNNNSTPVTQSLARIQRFEIAEPDYKNGKIAGILNIVALKDSKTFLSGTSDSIIAYFTDDVIPPNQIKSIKLDDVNIFDGDTWYVSFSKNRNDDPAITSLIKGNKYTLRCGRYGSDTSFVTSSFFTGSNIPVGSSFAGDLANSSGSQIIIGSQSLDFQTKLGIYGDDLKTDYDGQVEYTDFSGKIASIRFWSKGITEKEYKAHQKNYKNIGVENPNNNNIFRPKITSELLRLAVFGNQPVTSSDNGNIVLLNTTQIETHLSQDKQTQIAGFENNKSVLSFEKHKYTTLPNKIDELSSFNKIRINSLKENPNLNLGYQNIAPIFQIEKSSQINDDARFSIEMSLGRILNENINRELASVSFFENLLGQYNNTFSLGNTEFELFSRNYFKNLESDLEIDKLLDVYTWLESSFEDIIAKSLPKKTKFLGMNFVIEPHSLERSKLHYKYENAYMGNSENNEVKQSVSQISVFNGTLSRY